MKKDILAIAICVVGLLAVQDARAEDFEKQYFEEEVPYIFAYGKPFPEMTSFSCVNSKLYKGTRAVLDYKGKAVKCEIKPITRREYEDLNDVTRTF